MKNNDVEYYNKKSKIKERSNAAWLLILIVIFFSCLLISIGALFTYEDGGLEAGLLFMLITIAVSYPTYRLSKKNGVSKMGSYYGSIFKKSKEPFISIHDLVMNDITDDMEFSEEQIAKFERDTIKDINDAIKYGYLINCTLEIHDGVPVVALAKKIVKDKCPHCGAPVTGVYDASYICSYCGNKIVDVIEKK